MAPQTIDLPLVDDSEVFGVDYALPQTIDLPFVDGGVVFAPSVTVGTVTAGEVVAKVGATELTEAFGLEFQDPLIGAGSFKVSVQRDDPDAPDFDDLVTYEVAGVPRFAGVVTGRRVVTKAQGEEVDEIIVCSGPSNMGLLAESAIPPSRGIGSFPTEIVRIFAWMANDFDATAWPASKHIRRTDVRTARTPHRYSPEWWPDKLSSWVWAPRADVSELEAPLGRCLFIHDFTLAADAQLRVFVGMDNFGAGYFDGAKMIDTENDPSSYVIGSSFDIDTASAGTHRLAFNVKNLGRGGGLNFTVWSVDGDGLLDEMVTRSTAADVKCLGYPTVPPGFTFGRAFRLIVEALQAEGELDGITWDFSDFLDTAGNPWTSTPEISVTVGRSVLALVESCQDWLIDAHMTPGNMLRAWNHGTRGRVTGGTIEATVDPDTSEVEAMTHDGRHTRVNRFQVLYRGGWTEVEDAASIAALGGVRRSAMLDLGEVSDEATAIRQATKALALRSDPTYAVQATVLPSSVSTVRPYEQFEVGDTIGHDDETDTPTESRVRSIALRQNDDGETTWGLELRDVRREAIERHDLLLERSMPGGLGGGARIVSRSGEPLAPAVRISPNDVAEFSYDGDLASASTFSVVRPATISGNLIEIYGKLGTAGSTTTTLNVLMDGDEIGTLTFSAGVTVAEVDLNAAKVYGKVNEFVCEKIAAGTEAERLDVQVRAI